MIRRISVHILSRSSCSVRPRFRCAAFLPQDAHDSGSGGACDSLGGGMSMRTQDNYVSRISAAALCSAFMGLVVAIGIVAVAIHEHRPSMMRSTSLLLPLLDAGDGAAASDEKLAL